MSATVTRTVSPNPNDMTTLPVGAPGRCRFASARRRPVPPAEPTTFAARATSMPVIPKRSMAAVAPTTNQRAMIGLCAVPIASAASAANRSNVASAKGHLGTARKRTIEARNKPAAGRSQARAMGQMENAKAVNKPNDAASTRGCQYTSIRDMIGSSLCSISVAKTGASAPITNPRVIPERAMIITCIR